MYLDTRNEFHEIAAQDQALAGFNPLKAIGRALGATGRAIVGSVVPGGGLVKGVLDVAAKSPAGSGPAIAKAVETAVAAPAPAAAGQTPRPRRQRSTMPQADLVSQIKAAIQPAAAPTVIPSGGGSTISVSAPAAPAAPAAGGMPSWLPLAGIGALALVMMSQRGGSRR